MLRKYAKLANVFVFDEAHQILEGINEPFKTLKDLKWYGTEKIDGTNIRVYWDGHEVTIAGRTEKSEIPKHLLAFLEAKFKTQEAEYVFEQIFGDKEVHIFGEGYGFKIQDTKYKENEEVGFIVFDININGYDLDRNEIEEICERMGLEIVPVVFEGTLAEGIRFVKDHPKSKLNDNVFAEGIVCKPKGVMLYGKLCGMIRCKIKYRDVKVWQGEV